MLGAAPHAQWDREREVYIERSYGGALAALPTQPTPTTPSRRHSPSDLPTLLQMTTLYSTEGAPGNSWRLNRGVGGMQLFVPAKGRGSKQIRLPADICTISRQLNKPCCRHPTACARFDPCTC